MDEAEISVFKSKLIKGVLALTSRTFILQVIAFFSTFILTILLSPSVFGVFFIVSAVISFLSYFSDFGLAAALIQKKDEPTRDELVSVFTLQQILIGSICLISFILSPLIGNFYGLNPEGIFLLRALLVSFFISSLKTIPSVLLERKLKFELLIIPQISETLVFYIVAILLAAWGFGIVSFAYAALLRGLVGLVAIYLVSPWSVGLGFSFHAVRHLLNFGLPFQINSLLALVKDDLMTLFLGKFLPINHIGYLGWAKKWAEAPLRLIVDNIIRVTFPAYARLQENRIVLGNAISKSFFFLGLFMFPVSILLILYINPMINLIPKYMKWQPAIWAFYLFTISALFSSFSSPMVNALNAIGKIKSTLVLMVCWTLLTWIFVPVGAMRLGYNGVALASLIISFTAVLPIIMIRKIIFFPILKSLYKPIVSAILMAIPSFVILNLNQQLEFITFSMIVSITIYGVLIWFWMKEEISPYLPRFLKYKS